MLMVVGGEPILHRLPRHLVHDRGMLAFMDLTLVPKLTDVERIAEQLVQMPARERTPPVSRPAPSRRAGRVMPCPSRSCLQRRHRAVREVAREDRPHEGGMLLDDVQGAVLDPVAERRRRRPSRCPCACSRRSCRGCARR